MMFFLMMFLTMRMGAFREYVFFDDLTGELLWMRLSASGPARHDPCPRAFHDELDETTDTGPTTLQW